MTCIRMTPRLAALALPLAGLVLTTACNPATLRLLTQNQTSATGSPIPTNGPLNGGTAGEEAAPPVTGGTVLGFGINQVTVDIVEDPGGAPVSIFGGGASNPQTVNIPVDQSTSSTESSLLFTGGGVDVRLRVTIQDASDIGALGESLHSAAFIIFGVQQNTTTPAAIPGINLATSNGLEIRITGVQFRNNANTQTFTQVASRITSETLFGRYASVLYMRDLTLGGKFYNLEGVVGNLLDPNPGHAFATAQVTGQNFFNSPFGSYVADFVNPVGGDGGGGNGNLNGEFSYRIQTTAFDTANERSVIIDPALAIVPANLLATGGNATVHELAVACTFQTLP